MQQQNIHQHLITQHNNKYSEYLNKLTEAGFVLKNRYVEDLDFLECVIEASYKFLKSPEAITFNDSVKIQDDRYLVIKNTRIVEDLILGMYCDSMFPEAAQNMDLELENVPPAQPLANLPNSPSPQNILGKRDCSSVVSTLEAFVSKRARLSNAQHDWNGAVNESPEETIVSYRVDVVSKKTYWYVCKKLSKGYSFIAIADSTRDFDEEIRLLSQIKELDRHEVARIAKAILATSLSLISVLMINPWTYAIAVDVSKQGRRYFFDVRARMPSPNYRHVINLHLFALPLRVAHTGLNMKNILVKALKILDPDFSRCIRITSDGAASNLGKKKGLVSLLEPLMKPGFVKIWCGAH